MVLAVAEALYVLYKHQIAVFFGFKAFVKHLRYFIVGIAHALKNLPVHTGYSVGSFNKSFSLRIVAQCLDDVAHGVLYFFVIYFFFHYIIVLSPFGAAVILRVHPDPILFYEAVSGNARPS